MARRTTARMGAWASSAASQWARALARTERTRWPNMSSYGCCRAADLGRLPRTAGTCDKSRAAEDRRGPSPRRARDVRHWERATACRTLTERAWSSRATAA